MKILVAIILYKPDLLMVESLINVMKPYVQEFFLWDNTFGECGLNSILGISIHRNGKGKQNLGLSGAYNKAIEYANLKGYEYLLTMDQDSTWDGFDNYIRQVKRYEINKPNRSIYFANLSEDNKNSYYIMSMGGVNSGTIIPISFLNIIGGYNEDFFVDAIDDWLAIEAHRHGLECLLVGNCRIILKPGNRHFVKLLWKQCIAYDYPPYRLYGVFRNYMILWKYYPMSEECKRKVIDLFFKDWIKRIVFLEKNKYKKLKAIIYGIYDGLNRNPSRRETFM